MKHGIIVQTKTSRNEDVWLIVKNGSFDEQLVEWQQLLYSGDNSPNTIRSYVYGISLLWDYQFEYGQDYDLTSPREALKMLGHFKRALLKGDDRLQWAPKSKTSVKRILNGINSYSDLFGGEFVNPTIKSGSWRREFHKSNSFLAHLKTPTLREATKRVVKVKLLEPNWDMKYFPIKYVAECIRGASCARDSCLYALLAMGGLRISEALNIWLDDISYEADTLKVKIISPEERRAELWRKYRLLPDPFIRNKGRTNREVFFLDGGELFMEAFERYIYKERPPVSDHPYLFVNIKTGKYNGLRLTPSSARDSLILRCERLGIDHYSPHSLRHFYGVFAINVLRELNPAIQLDVVQTMMGHRDIDNTKKYAVFMPGTIRKELEAAYIKLRRDGTMTFS